MKFYIVAAALAATTISYSEAFKLKQADLGALCFDHEEDKCEAPAERCISSECLVCPTITRGGFGQITSKSKIQSKNAAKADNEFESVEEKLCYDGTESEQEESDKKEEGCLISTEVIKING